MKHKITVGTQFEPCPLCGEGSLLLSTTGILLHAQPACAGYDRIHGLDDLTNAVARERRAGFPKLKGQPLKISGQDLQEGLRPTPTPEDN